MPNNQRSGTCRTTAGSSRLSWLGKSMLIWALRKRGGAGFCRGAGPPLIDQSGYWRKHFRKFPKFRDFQNLGKSVAIGRRAKRRYAEDNIVYDAIVIGARCAGSPTAMLLARQGYRVLLVDRSTFPSDMISTHYIHNSGIAHLKRWGLARQGCWLELPAHYSRNLRCWRVRSDGISPTNRRCRGSIRPAAQGA